MKNFIICVGVIICLLFGISFVSVQNSETFDCADFLRIHIRANSNHDEDQNIKYAIKDEVVEYLIPYISECETKDEAIDLIFKMEVELENFVDEILEESNFKYVSNIKVCNEYFPTRDYDGVVLSSGFYDAIIVELGTAEGDNWWCVMYPPLCFSTDENNLTNVEYKSKIVQIIEMFFKRGENEE